MKREIRTVDSGGGQGLNRQLVTTGYGSTTKLCDDDVRGHVAVGCPVCDTRMTRTTTRDNTKGVSRNTTRSTTI